MGLAESEPSAACMKTETLLSVIVSGSVGLQTETVEAGPQNMTGRDNGSVWWMCCKLDFLSRSQESRVVCF